MKGRAQILWAVWRKWLDILWTAVWRSMKKNKNINLSSDIFLLPTSLQHYPQQPNHESNSISTDRQRHLANLICADNEVLLSLREEGNPTLTCCELHVCIGHCVNETNQMQKDKYSMVPPSDVKYQGRQRVELSHGTLNGKVSTASCEASDRKVGKP